MTGAGSCSRGIAGRAKTGRGAGPVPWALFVEANVHDCRWGVWPTPEGRGPRLPYGVLDRPRQALREDQQSPQARLSESF